MSIRTVIPPVCAAFMTVLSMSGAEPITASQIVDRIKAHVNCTWSDQTVDTFKAGDPNTPVTGIATTFMATQAVQDASAQGKHKAMILPGHANSEEAGMKFVTQWLRGFVTELPIKLIPAGDQFTGVK